MEKRNIIMDCAFGTDGPAALAFAAAHPEAFELLAITVVSSSGSIEGRTENALNLAAFYGLDVPVAKGMDEPLVKNPSDILEECGENMTELCDLPKAPGKAVEEHAVLYLYRILTKLPQGKKVTFAAAGPLTNIAMLLKLFPQVKEHIREIVFMGGAAMGGNVTAAAEFHMYADPEAARIVLRSGIPLVMCGLDAALKCTLKRNQIVKLCQSCSPAAKLCGDMAGYRLENTSSKYRGEVSIYDAVPFMYLLHPEIFMMKRTILDVDCSDSPARGTTICDFRWWEHDEEEMDSLVLLDVDGSKFQEYLITALYELGDILKGRKEEGKHS